MWGGNEGEGDGDAWKLDETRVVIAEKNREDRVHKRHTYDEVCEDQKGHEHLNLVIVVDLLRPRLLPTFEHSSNIGRVTYGEKMCVGWWVHERTCKAFEGTLASSTLQIRRIELDNSA